LTHAVVASVRFGTVTARTTTGRLDGKRTCYTSGYVLQWACSNGRSLNYFVRSQDQRLRKVKPSCFGRLEIEHERESRRLLDG